MQMRPQPRGARTLSTILVLIGALTFPLVLATTALAASVPVLMQNNVFTPAETTIQAGDTITWTSRDPEAHTVTFLTGPEKPDSPELNDGQSFSHTFKLPGDYTYTCVLHEGMDGKVKVLAAPSGGQTTGLPRSGEPTLPLELVALAGALIAVGGTILLRRSANPQS